MGMPQGFLQGMGVPQGMQGMAQSMGGAGGMFDAKRAQLLAEGMALISGSRTSPPPSSKGEYQQSYNASTVSRDLDFEVERLRLQAKLTWAKEARTLAGLGLGGSMRVLEVGCGAGWVSFQMLEHFANISIVCVELDEVLIEQAHKATPDHVKSRLTIVHGSIETVKLAEADFDFAVARFVLQHVPEPVVVAERVHALLGHGGVFVIIDVDDAVSGMLEPPLPSLSPLGMLSAVRQSRLGGDRTIGRRLGRVLLLASYTNISLELLLNHVDEAIHSLDDFRGNLAPERFLPLLREAYITQAEYDVAAHDMAQLLASDYPIIATINVVASASKI